MNLMAHLARHGIPCPQPIAKLDNEFLGELNGKPASIVTCVPGADLKEVDAGHCATIGGLLAQMHLAGRSYAATMPNPRGPQWWSAAMPQVTPFLDAAAAPCSAPEVRFQTAQRHDELPRGAIHADLFRDNVLWDGARVGGVIDFYFACTDCLLYDVAITVNDWCVTPAPTLDAQRAARCLPRTTACALSPPANTPRGRSCCAPARCASGCRGSTISTCRGRARWCTPRTRHTFGTCSESTLRRPPNLTGCSSA